MPVFNGIIDLLPDLTAPDLDPETVVDLVRDGDVRTAFRYLAAPPISEDDLKTLAETTLSASALRKDPAQARRVRDIVLHIIDPHRFPWVGEQRQPSASRACRSRLPQARLSRDICSSFWALAMCRIWPRRGDNVCEVCVPVRMPLDRAAILH